MLSLKRCLLFLVLLTAGLSGKAQSLYFPPLTGNTWDTLTPASLGWCASEIDTLYDFLDSTNTRGFIVLKDGKIVLEKYFGSFTVDSLWYWASAGKSLTAVLTGIAQQEGFLEINDTSSQYLGSGWTVCPQAKEEKITIRNQLSMTSGLDDGVADPYCTDDTCLQYLADAGTRWAYHNAPYTLLDDVIQSATGQTLNSYFIQKVGLQTGIAGLFVQSGYNNLFVSTPRSMARFGLMILAGGAWNGNPIVTDPVYFQDMITSSQSLNPSYGYLWWLNGKPTFMVPGLQFQFPGPLSPNAPSDMVAAMGKNGQLIHVVPSQNLVVIRMGDAPGTGEVPYTYSDSTWVYLNRVICTASTDGNISSDMQLSVYPNPINDFNAVVHLGSGNYDGEITDSKGAQLISFRNASAVDMSALDKGVYFIRLMSDQKVITRKIVKY
jgi:CubicO group peptidase (beta-lactamase class C family)